MSAAISESATSAPRVVDLSTVKPAELDGLWQREVQLWRERLFWDVTGTIAAVRRLLERGGLSGKAVRVGAETAGYACYVIAGRLGVISSLVVSPDCSPEAAGLLLQDTIAQIRNTGVARIESPFVSIDGPCLPPLFEREGFRTFWREFMRCNLRRPQEPMSAPAKVRLESWRGTDRHEAVSIMQAAYAGGVDADISEQYRTYDGCQVVLENILWQGGGGIPLLEASAMARQGGRGIGFIILTEIAHRQGHLAQVAVLPEYQGQGVGRLLLGYGLSRLAELGFDAISLIVSRPNQRALGIYQVMGFRSVLSFPVFAWDR